MSNQKCPICANSVEANPRWPRYICGRCAGKATDKNGRRVSYGNEDAWGGLEAGYVESDEKYEDVFCYVEETRCKAYEGKFGGVFIQTITAEETELLDTLEELNVFVPYAERLADSFKRASTSPEVQKEVEEMLADPFFGEGGVGVREALLLLLSNFNINK